VAPLCCGSREGAPPQPPNSSSDDFPSALSTSGDHLLRYKHHPELEARHWRLFLAMVELTVDVLYHLTAYLNDRDLRNFSLVNRLFNDVSKRYLYRTIIIKFASPDLLDIAVATWARILDRANAFKYVRHVKILAKHLDDYRRDRDGDFNLCGDDPKATWKYCMVNTFGDWIKPGVFMAEVQVLLTRDSQWNDLSHFMLNFPNLQELTWGCEEQIPASLFRCVTQNHPGLRLYMRNFKLESLNKDPEHSAVSALTPYEIELATSPCLYSITMMLRDVYTYAFEHAIMDMLAGAAPNLREVDLYAIDAFDEREIAPKHRRGTQLPTSSSGLGALRHFGIYMIEQLNVLRDHGLVTDFSKLESLELHHIMAPAELRWLADVHLPALEHLTFNMDDIARDYDEPAHELVADMNEVVTNFIPSLPALQSIKMGGPFDEQTIRVVLDHCGHNLRRLLLSSYKLEGSAYDDARLIPAATVDVELIQEIRQKCPNLEELALTVPRSKDDPAEFAIYRALGTLASIRKIHLNITCPQSSFGHRGTIQSFSRTCASERPLTEEQEAELDNGLSSLAIDESLA